MRNQSNNNKLKRNQKMRRRVMMPMPLMKKVEKKEMPHKKLHQKAL